jgi:hypothetical protein
MSTSERPPGHDGQQPAPPPPASARSGCLSALMVLGGAVLLLPGLCAIIVIVGDWKSALSASTLPVMLIFLAVAFGGIMMIRAAMRGPRP